MPPVGLVAVAATESGGAELLPLADDGTKTGPVETVATADELAAVVAKREAEEAPRWLWATTGATYPRLLQAGVRVGRCHDVELIEALLSGHAGRWGEPRGLAAVWARSRGLPVPPDPPPPPASTPTGSRSSSPSEPSAPTSPTTHDAAPPAAAAPSSPK